MPQTTEVFKESFCSDHLLARRQLSKTSGGNNKMRFLPTLVGLALGFAVPVLAQEQNTVDPEVRQQIEAVVMKYEEAYNKSDAAGCAALYSQDGLSVVSWESAGGATSGQQAIEKRAA